MLKRQSKIAFNIILGGFILMAVAIGCNDTASTKTTNTDSVVVSDSLKVDTIKMDTANTKPIVSPPN